MRKLKKNTGATWAPER